MSLPAYAKIIAKTPPAIAMAIGGIMVMAGRPQGWLAFFIGAILNGLWIFARYS